VLSLAVALLAPLPVTQSASSAVAYVAGIARLFTPQGASPTKTSQPGDDFRRGHVPRLKLMPRESREITLDEVVVAVTTVDPQTVGAEISGERSVRLTGLVPGETILIVSGKSARNTYAVEVSRPLRAARPAPETARQVEKLEPFSGSYALSFSPASQGGPLLLRNNFEFNQKLGHGRVLRAGADVFNFFGGGGRGLTYPLGFGANRLVLGLDSPAGKLDVLDSELDVSRLSLSGYTMRGPHMVSSRTSALRGAELFAGAARPSPNIFDGGEGRLAGIVAPVFEGRAWRLRAGAILVDPAREESGSGAGIVWQTDALYMPDEKTRVEFEAAYACGGLSWRALLDAQRGGFRLRGESFRLDRRSPFIRLGAQPAGRQTYAFDLQWRPGNSAGLSVGFSRTTAFPSEGLWRTPLNRSSLYFNAHLKTSRSSRVSFNFTQQNLEAAVATNRLVTWQLQTRSALLRHSLRLDRRWSNDIEARFTFSREAEAGTRMSRGLNIREQLRYSRGNNSVTAYFNYQNNTPSLAGLVARNPALLPEAARAAFEADPAGFLLTNRELLPQLLPGVELPLTRSTEVGLRLQTALSRINVVGDLRYSAGEVFASERRDLLTNFGAALRLDAANSVQVSGALSFAFKAADGGRSALTVTFVHRFGAQGRGGLQLSELLGLNRGRIQGRVFTDLNGDGRDDPGEPGVAAMTVLLDYDRSVRTDAGGRFSFDSVPPGEHGITLASDDLGVRLRASTATEQRVYLAARQTARVAFGLNDFGSVSGRVFNDLFLTGESAASDAPGVGGVRILLRPAGAGLPALVRTADAAGFYEFRNLPPGHYTLDVDLLTFPADFRLSARTPWAVTVEPLRGSYLDLPLAAQRAVSGVVFLDRDGDGRFDPQQDEPLSGVKVTTAGTEVLTDQHGSYVVRNLPVGRSELHALWAAGRKTGAITVELSAAPVLLRQQNIAVR
jgi:hypothetical protein